MPHSFCPSELLTRNLDYKIFHDVVVERALALIDRGCDQVVSLFAYYSDNPSLNPPEVYIFTEKLFLERFNIFHAVAVVQANNFNSGIGTSNLTDFLLRLT